MKLTKYRKLTLGLLSGLMLASVAALADPVTFQVDMSVQAALGNFSPGNGDTVLVAGNWDNWATTNTLTVSTTNANIYQLTVNLAANSYPNYEFVIDPGGTSSGSGLNWEVPASFGGGDRWFEVPAGGTNLPVVYFSDESSVPAYPVQVTFSVDMAAPISQGLLTIGSDYVDAFGSFNNWSTSGVLLTNVPGTSNYVGSYATTTLTTNTVITYKYAIDGNGGTWEGNVGPNGTQNRAFTLTSTNQVLPLDYWNNVTNANVSYLVGFEVDLTANTALGNFDPAYDTVYVNGDWNWSGSALQLQPTSDPYVYTGAVSLALSPGTTVNYKYTLNGGVIWEGNVGPAGAQNRRFILPSVATNLPADYFNNISNLGPLYVSKSGTQTTLSWPTGTNVNSRIRLQSSASLSSGWSDVANTQGQSSITNNFGSGTIFFRLIGP
jgi:hypothetical protein